MGTTENLIEDWRAAAADEAYFSASRVQSRLFDLYGAVDHEPARQVVEFWLSLTVQRDLFSGPELLEMLDELAGRLPDRVSG